jgi:hypothetical protein
MRLALLLPGFEGDVKNAGHGVFYRGADRADGKKGEKAVGAEMGTDKEQDGYCDGRPYN